MRKPVIVLLLALMLTGSLLIASAVGLSNAQEQVTYTVSGEYGDSSAADGLTVSVTYTFDRYPYWFSSITFGEQNVEKTDFRYVYGRLEQGIQSRYVGGNLLLNTVSDSDQTDFQHQLDELEEAPSGLLLAYKELYDRTEEGSVTNTYIRYADYCDYYPLEGQFVIPGMHRPDWSSYDQTSSAKSIAKVFGDYFRIPILQDDWIRMLVDKRATTSSMTAVDMSEPRKGTDYYEMGSAGTYLNGTVYFALNAYTNGGKLVDTSLIPGGYGLYSFRFDKKGHVIADSLTTVMPLDIRHRPVQMLADTQTGWLLYVSELEGDRYLTVIDPKEGRILQQLCIQERSDAWRWYRFEDEFLYCVTEDQEIDVFLQNADSLYEKVLTAPLRETDALYQNRDLYESAFAFDGERLAVVSALWSELGEQACGFSLSVYTKDGTVYSGNYISSLEQIKDAWWKEFAYTDIQVHSWDPCWSE